MAKEHSFDITAKINLQHFKDALSQAQKEVVNRYDFKGSTATMEFKEKEKQLILIAASDNKLEALEDILVSKLIKHQLSSKVLEKLRTEDASGNTRKMSFKIVDYIEAKEAKKIVAEIKNLKLKVTATIEGDAIRIKGKQLDELQAVIATIRSLEWEAPLVFENMR